MRNPWIVPISLGLLLLLIGVIVGVHGFCENGLPSSCAPPNLSFGAEIMGVGVICIILGIVLFRLKVTFTVC